MAKPRKRTVKPKASVKKTFAPKPERAMPVPATVPTPVEVDEVHADDVVHEVEADETPIKPVRRVSVESIAAIAATPASDETPEGGRWPRLERPVEPAWRRGWEWLKAKALFWRKHDGMPEHLAAVKAGVLHQLEALGAEKGMALQGGPFRSVVLPTVRRKRRWGWPLVALLVLVVVLAMVLVGRGPASPEKVLARAMGAVASHDLGAFEARVDVASVASSIINQTFSAPRLNVATLPPELREQLLHGNGDVAARMNAYIKPGLAENLRDEMLAAVKTGAVDSGDGNLLGKLWRDLGGPALQIGAPRIMASDARTAMAEVPLRRSDLALTLPLQVVLARTADGWQVVDIPNMAAVLDGMQRATAAKAQAAQAQGAMAPADLADRVQVLDVVKAKGLTPGGSLMVTMTVHNAGQMPLHDLQLQVAFGDAAGQPMKTAIVVLDGVLDPGQSREQTWAVPLDRSHGAERYVADLPLSALSVAVVPVGSRD